MPTLSDSMVRMLTPAAFNGKTHGEALAYLACARSFINNLPMGFTPELKFMTLLNLLVKDAAVWAILFYPRLGASLPPWLMFYDFEHNFKVHFCPVSDATAVFKELKNWGCGVSYPWMANLQEWTVKLNTLVVHTTLSNEDKQMRYYNMLLHNLHHQLAVTSGDVSTVAKMQMVLLCMAQSLAADVHPTCLYVDSLHLLSYGHCFQYKYLATVELFDSYDIFSLLRLLVFCDCSLA